MVRPNGVTTSYTYDPAGRLASLSHSAPSVTAGSVQSFGYNPAGQLVAQDRSGNGVSPNRP